MIPKLNSLLFFALATSALAIPQTTTSPAGGVLPTGVTEVGGIVVDLVGLNGGRIVSQLPASSLYVGDSMANTPIGTQSGFNNSIMSMLGGGLASAAVRITLEDGDSAAGNFDANQNTLLVNGISFGNFSGITTYTTDSTGTSLLGTGLGFPNNQLATGFFSLTVPADLLALYNSILSTNQLAFVLADVDPDDNYLDFSAGVDGGLAAQGQGPAIVAAAIAANIDSGLMMANTLVQSVLGAGGTVLNDVGGHLAGLRHDLGEEDGIGVMLDLGVIPGEGDGPESGALSSVKADSSSYAWSAYMLTNYGNAAIGGTTTQAGVDIDTWAPGVGIERRLAPGLKVGFAFSFLHSEQTFRNGVGNLNMEGPAVSTYLSYVRKNLWADLLYNFGSYRMDTVRNPGPAFPTAYGHTRADTHAIQFNTGWNFRFMDNTLITGPFVGIDYLGGEIDAYSETGGGLGALAYGKQSFDSLVTRVGWSVAKHLKYDFARITPHASISYERQNVQNNGGTSAQFINAPIQGVINSQTPGQDYMVGAAGVNFQFSDRFAFLISYQGQFFRSDMQAHYGGIRLSYSF